MTFEVYSEWNVYCICVNRWSGVCRQPEQALGGYEVVPGVLGRKIQHQVYVFGYGVLHPVGRTHIFISAGSTSGLQDRESRPKTNSLRGGGAAG